MKTPKSFFRTAKNAALIYAGVFMVALILDVTINSNGERDIAPIFAVLTFPAIFIDDLAHWLERQLLSDYIGGLSDFFIMLLGGGLFWASVAVGFRALTRKKETSRAIKSKA